jgi:ribonuclease D
LYPPEITKEAIARMPREVFKGRIVIVDTPECLQKAIVELSACQEIGFDTETRPNFTKDSHHRVALMQLSTNDVCYLVRLNRFPGRMPPSLDKFIKDKQIKKIGLSLRDDFNGLNNLKHITPTNFIDLQNFVADYGIAEMSLQKIYAIIFGKKISKRERLTNWEAKTLTMAQQRYAALDAWSCLHIYQHLKNSA